MRRTVMRAAGRAEPGWNDRRRLFAIVPLVVVLLLTTACWGNPDEETSDTPKDTIRVVAPIETAAVGQPVTLKLFRVTYVYDQDAEKWVRDPKEEPLVASGFAWRVIPDSGATCSEGVFTATEPGEYTVDVDSGREFGDVRGASIAVTDQPAQVEYDNHNDKAVQNGGKPATFEVADPVTLDSIETYHWNDGSGSSGSGEITLKAEDGTVYGPWETEGTPGQGGVPNAYWTASPAVELPPGSYTVIDSDPGTWSQNSGSKGMGMIRVYTVPEK